MTENEPEPPEFTLWWDRVMKPLGYNRGLSKSGTYRSYLAARMAWKAATQQEPVTPGSAPEEKPCPPTP